MESAAHSSTNGKSNYANLCRLLVEVGPLVLSEIFNKVCPPGKLYTVLGDTKNYEKLQTLRKKRVLSNSQWRKLYPVVRLTVSSKHFDSSLVLLLLSNIFGVTLPASGWNSIPLITDKSPKQISPKADITQIKILRDKVYSHAADDSVDDTLFNSYWYEIKGTFRRMGGAWYEDAINDLKPVCMDADQEEHYQECLTEWLKDDDFITDESHEQGTIKKARKKEDMDGSMEISGEKLGMEGIVVLPVKNRPAYNGSANPPEHSVKLSKITVLPDTSFAWSNVELPVDLLLLTVEDCEFLSCFAFLKEPFRSYHISTGPVYFGWMGDDEGKMLKIALRRCPTGSEGPECTLFVKDTILLLRPKATISIGACSGLNNGKVKLGDVIVSSWLITAKKSTPPSSNFNNMIKYMADGWKAPLKNANAYNVKVHCDGVLLSLSKANKDMIDQYPEAFAVEMEDGAISAACSHFKTEWLVVKGIKNFIDEEQSSDEKRTEFASVMAASVVDHSLRDSIIFQDWLHFNPERTCRNYDLVPFQCPKVKHDIALCKESGIEEEYNELACLLKDTSSYVADSSINQIDDQEGKKKEEQDKMEGMEMRKAAMETHSKRKFKEMDEEESTGVERKKSSKRVGTSQMLEYLSHKHSDDLKLREKELELVGRRLHLEERKMKLEEMKWQAMLQSQKENEIFS